MTAKVFVEGDAELFVLAESTVEADYELTGHGKITARYFRGGSQADLLLAASNLLRENGRSALAISFGYDADSGSNNLTLCFDALPDVYTMLNGDSE